MIFFLIQYLEFRLTTGTMELFQKALIASTDKPASKSGSDSTVERSKKVQKTPSKPIDRAKSRYLMNINSNNALNSFI